MNSLGIDNVDNLYKNKHKCLVLGMLVYTVSWYYHHFVHDLLSQTACLSHKCNAISHRTI